MEHWCFILALQVAQPALPLVKLPHSTYLFRAAGDFIDEDTQQVQTRGGASADLLGLPAGAAAAGDAPPAVTNASWRMYKWMRDYAALMR